MKIGKFEGNPKNQAWHEIPELSKIMFHYSMLVECIVYVGTAMHLFMFSPKNSHGSYIISPNEHRRPPIL